MALSMIRAQLPKLIMLDIVMPDLDGYEVCRELKADETTRDIPVIFISSLDDALDKVRAFKAGGNDSLHKPVPGAAVSFNHLPLPPSELA